MSYGPSGTRLRITAQRQIHGGGKGQCTTRDGTVMAERIVEALRVTMQRGIGLEWIRRVGMCRQTPYQ